MIHHTEHLFITTMGMVIEIISTGTIFKILDGDIEIVYLRGITASPVTMCMAQILNMDGFMMSFYIIIMQVQGVTNMG